MTTTDCTWKMPAHDQAVKADAGKPRISLCPVQIIYDITEVREYGTEKYGDPNNWQYVDPQRYRDALLRHTLEYMKDHKSVDPESGIPHYKHMCCNMAFLCEWEAGNVEVDE